MTYNEAVQVYNQKKGTVRQGFVAAIRCLSVGNYEVIVRPVKEREETRKSSGKRRDIMKSYDEISPVQHPVSGKTYTSAAKFRADTKAYGCQEVGNDKPRIKRDAPNHGDPRPYLNHVYDTLASGGKIEN